MNLVLIKDQTIGGEEINKIELQFSENVINVKELIEARVTAEVEVYNKNEKEQYYGLVTPTKIEKLLNSSQNLNKNRKVDVEKQVYVALDGFIKNQFFIIINDKQVEDLDHEIMIDSLKQVQFIKLTPLVGG